MSIEMGSWTPNPIDLQELSSLSFEGIGEFFAKNRTSYEKYRNLILYGHDSDALLLNQYPRVMEGLVHRLVVQEPDKAQITAAVLKILGKTGLGKEYPLHAAILEGNAAVLEALLESGVCNLNEKNGKGQTPFDLLAEVGTAEYLEQHPRILTLLILHHKEFLSPVFAFPKKMEFYSHFLKKLDDAERLIQLQSAIAYGHTGAVRDILEEGVDLTSCYEKNPELTPMHQAVLLGNAHLVMLFLEHGVQINIRNGKKQTPLDLVLLSREDFGHAFFLFLVDRGAKVTENGTLSSPLNKWLNKLCEKPLHHKELLILHALIVRGADPSPHAAKQIVIRALVNQHYGLVLLCLEKCPELTLEGSDWDVGVLCSDPYWLIHVAEEMFKRGMSVTDVFKSGKSLFDLAYEKKNREFAGYLVTRGAKLNAKAQADAAFQHYVQEIQKSATKPAEQRLRHLLTMKNLGHLLGDAFMRKMVDEQGRKLQGSMSVSSMAFTFCLLDYLVETRQDILSEDDLQKIAKLSRELKESYAFAWEIEDASSTEDKATAGLILRDLSNKLQRRIVKADIGQVIPIPLGWVGPKGGHAIMASFSRLANGRIQMRVTNTGAAAANVQSNRVQDYVALEEIFEFSEQELVEKQHLFKLLELNVMGNIPKHFYGEAQLKFILESIRQDMGEPIISRRTRRAQFSGTCTMRCQLANLQAVLGDEVYKKLSLPMKVDVTEFASEQLQEYLREEKQLRKLLHLVTSNLARRMPIEGVKTGMEQLDRLAKVKEVLTRIPKKIRKLDALETPLSLLPYKRPKDSVVELEQGRPESHEVSHYFPMKRLGDIGSSEELFNLLNEQMALVEHGDPDASSPIASQFILDLSIGLIRAYGGKSTEFSLIFRELRENRVACEGLIEGLSQLTEQLARQQPKLPSVNREIAGQAALCAGWIVSSLLEDALALPKSYDLRIDDFALYEGMMEHIVSLPNLIPLENPYYLLTDPLVSEQAHEIYEFMISRGTRPLFGMHYQLQTENRFLEGYYDNRNEILLSPVSQGTYIFTLDGTFEREYCEAHVKKRLLEQSWSPEQANAAYEAQIKVLEKGGKIVPAKDSFYAHWLYMNQELPAHFYLLNKIALNGLQLKANYKENRINDSLSTESSEPLHDKHPQMRIKPKSRLAIETRVVVAYEVESNGQYPLVTQYFKPSVLNRQTFLPQNAKDVAVHINLQDQYSQPTHNPLSLSCDNENVLWVAPAPDKRRLFALCEHFRDYVAPGSNLVFSQMLDYFSECASELEEDSSRLLMLYILCRPGRLKKALENSPEFALEVQAFFVNLMNTFKDRLFLGFNPRKARETVGFLYQCYIFVLTTMGMDATIGNRPVPEILKEVRAEMQALVKDESWAKDPQAVMYLCLNRIASYQSKSTLQEKDATDLLEARFLYKYLLNLLPDSTQVLPSVSPQYISNTLAAFATRLQEIHSLASDTAVRAVIAKGGAQIGEASTIDRSDFPNIHAFTDEGNRVTLSIPSGALFVEGQESSILPQSILDHKFYIKLFGKRLFPCVKLENAYEGRLAGEHYRFEVVKEGEVENLKRICLHHEGVWHEYTPDNIRTISEFLPAIDYPKIRVLDYFYTNWKKLDNKNPGNLLVSETGSLKMQVNAKGQYYLDGKWYEQCLDLTFRGTETIRAFDRDRYIWQEVSNKPEKKLFIKCPSYRDESGKRVAFELVRNKDPKRSRWVMQSAPHLFISTDQTFEDFEAVSSYLILEDNKGDRYLLLPKLDKAEMEKRGGVSPSSRVFCMRLEKGKPQAQEAEKLALLAYHKLLSAHDPSDYIEVMRYLEKAKKFDRYTEEELRLFGWIFNAYKSTQDRTIVGDSIRLYTMWLVEDNLRRNPVLRGKEEPLKEVPKNDANGKDWERYWMGYIAIPSRTKHRVIANYDTLKKRLAKRYLAHHHRLPAELRLENLVDAQEFLDFNLERHAARLGKVDQSLSFPLTQALTKKNQLLNLLSKSQAVGMDSKLLPREQLRECFGTLYLMAQSKDANDRQRVRQIVNDSALDDYTDETISNSFLRMLLAAVCDYHDPSTQGERLELSKEIFESIQFITSKPIGTDLSTKLYWLDHTVKAYDSITRLQTSNPEFELVEPAELFQIEEVQLASSPKTPQFRFDKTIPQSNVLTQMFERCFDKEGNKEFFTEFVPFELDTKDDSLKKSLAAFNEDCRIGHEQLTNASVYKLKSSVSKEDVLAYSKNIQNALENHRNRLGAYEHDILNFVQKLIAEGQDQQKQFEAKRGEVSGSVKPLELSDYIGMFLHADPEVYERLTGIRDKAKQLELHELIGGYLLESTSMQAVERTSTWMKKLQEISEKVASGALSEENADEEIQDIIQNLAEESGFVWQVNPREDNPALLVFQERMGVALQAKQLAAVREMMKKHPDDPHRFMDVMIQLIQGGGKTFFIAPTIAMAKADGYHASFLVSPTSQFTTNLPNLRTISKRAYGQHERTLFFDDSPQHATPKYLKWMLGYIKQTIHNRAYINVTKETLRALLCKETKERIRGENPESYRLLKEIRQLIKERGAFTFDEAHKAYSPWSVLNMPSGEPYAPDPQEVSLMAGLFTHALLEKQGRLDVLHSSEQDTTVLKEIASGAAKALLNDQKWQKTLGLLDSNGALISTRAAELEDFVFGRRSDIPEYLEDVKKKAGAETCAGDLAVLLMKSIHGNWLVDRLMDRMFVNHGKKEVPGQPTVSRPYKANMKPEDQSEFSDVYVMIYNTLIAYAVEEITLNQTKALIIAWRAGALEEYAKEKEQNSEFRLANTKKVKQFHAATGLDLYRLDEGVNEDLLQVQQALRKRDWATLELLFDYVAQEELRKVKLYPIEISSSGQDTAAMARSQNSFSGSADNPYMLPVGTAFQPDQGTNGQTIALIRNKKTELWAMEKNYESLFHDVMDVHPQKARMRAIIDVGAHFVGMTNEDVAEMICKHNKNPQITKVLYFNTDSNELYAMDVADTAVRTKLSGTSEQAISQETGVGPEQRFTFYDNFNIEGTDILQMRNAIAIVTMNDKNTTTEQIQGEQRLRNLKGRQQVVVAAHTNTLQRVGETLQDPSLKNVKVGRTNVAIDVMQLNGHLQLENKKPEEVLLLALQKMQAALKLYVQSKLDALAGDEEQELSKATEYLFIKNVRRSLYKEFAHKPKSINTKKFLKAYLRSLVAPLEALKVWFSLEELGDLEKRIKEKVLKPIYDSVPPTVELHSDQMSVLSPDFNQQSTQTQFRNQMQLQQQQQQQQQNQQQLQFRFHDDHKYNMATSNPWNLDKLVELEVLEIAKIGQKSGSLSNGQIPIMNEILLLNEALQIENPSLLKGLAIDPNILIDSNFACVFSNRIHFVGGYRKSLDYIALIKDSHENGTKSWKALILDQPTARQLEQHLAGDKPLKPSGRKIWLVRATGKFAPYKSMQCPPDNTIFEDPEVKQLMTQILFFSGNMNLLNRKPWLDELDKWLPQNAEERSICKKNYEEVIVYGNITSYKGSALEKVLSRVSF